MNFTNPVSCELGELVTERWEHPSLTAERLVEIDYPESSVFEQFKDGDVDQRADGLDDVKGETVATEFVGVDDAEPGVESDCH